MFFPQNGTAVRKGFINPSGTPRYRPNKTTDNFFFPSVIKTVYNNEQQLEAPESAGLARSRAVATPRPAWQNSDTPACITPQLHSSRRRCNRPFLPSVFPPLSSPKRAFLRLQFRLGEKPLELSVVCSRNGTAALKGLSGLTNTAPTVGLSSTRARLPGEFRPITGRTKPPASRAHACIIAASLSPSSPPRSAHAYQHILQTTTAELGAYSGSSELTQLPPAATCAVYTATT